MRHCVLLFLLLRYDHHTIKKNRDFVHFIASASWFLHACEDRPTTDRDPAKRKPGNPNLFKCSFILTFSDSHQSAPLCVPRKVRTFTPRSSLMLSWNAVSLQRNTRVEIHIELLMHPSSVNLLHYPHLFRKAGNVSCRVTEPNEVPSAPSSSGRQLFMVADETFESLIITRNTGWPEADRFTSSFGFWPTAGCCEFVQNQQSHRSVRQSACRSFCQFHKLFV